ncbi:MAG TPA: tetratricopeptide repeat protein [Acidimicrobiia bacterium]|nr:tetratricopeptide repeat protein [Acidimicrobiia bacterium]
MSLRGFLTLVGALASLLGSGLADPGLRAQEDPPAQTSDQFVVAVLPFASSDNGKAKDLQEEIIAGMNDLGAYTLIEADQINDAVGQAGMSPGGAIPDVQGLEIGRDLQARIIARGTLENRGGTWVATPSFVDVATRNTQNLPSVEDDDMDDLAKKVVEAFNNRNQADKHIIFGRDYVRGEQYDRAITNFQQALEYDPDLAAAYYYIGDTYLKMDRLDPALEALEKAVELDPAYISAYHSIGTAYLEKGDSAQARDFFETLVSKKPDDCQIQVAYGYVMANQLGQVDKGLQAFEKAKSLCPDEPAPYQYLAYALPQDRSSEKIDNLKRYLELNEGAETDLEALQYLFGLYFADERYQEAKTTIDQALAADPANANLQLYAGVVESKLGNHSKAVEQYTRALGINPDLERAYLFRALAHQEMGNTTAMAQDLERAGRGQSREIMANIFLREAAQSLRAGRPGAAFEALNNAERLGGDRCAIAYYRGDGYYQLGKANEGEDKSIAQNEKARGQFQQAIGYLQSACGQYSSYAQGLIGNSNQYITRVDAIIKKLSRGR